MTTAKTNEQQQNPGYDIPLQNTVVFHIDIHKMT